MRISDWSSDVCSSDLLDRAPPEQRRIGLERFEIAADRGRFADHLAIVEFERGHRPARIDREIRVATLLVRAQVDHHALNLDPLFGERSEEHTSELPTLMRISYAVFCLKKKKQIPHQLTHSI